MIPTSISTALQTGARDVALDRSVEVGTNAVSLKETDAQALLLARHTQTVGNSDVDFATVNFPKKPNPIKHSWGWNDGAIVFADVYKKILVLIFLRLAVQRV